MAKSSQGGQVRARVTQVGAGEGAASEDTGVVRQRYSEELLRDTAAVCGRRAGCEFSGEDVRQILENLTGYFGVLKEWEARSREGGGGGTDGTKSPIRKADDGRQSADPSRILSAAPGDAE